MEEQNEQDVEAPETLPPGLRLMSKLEEIFLLRPSLFPFQRRSHFRYWASVSFIILVTIFYAVRFFIGFLSPTVGLQLGNYLNVAGVGGQMTSISGFLYHILLVYLRIRLLLVKEVPFLYDIVDYDNNSSTRRSALTGEYKTRVVKSLETSLSILRIASRIMVSNIIFSALVAFLVIPLMVLGVTWNNVIFWTLTNILMLVVVYYSAMDWVYIWGSWFICKNHLDIQANYLIEWMERLVETNGGIEVKEIEYLEAQYRRLVSRVKTFDKLSRDLISPYRFVVSYVGGITMFFVHQTDNVLFQVAIDSCVALVYVLSLSFLLTACSLSNRRRRMYFLANCLFVKVGSSRGHSLRESITLRRMVKSLGDDDCHTLCLTDKSGDEFNPMEFVGFILGTFSNFTLVVGFYNDYVK